MSVYYRLHNFLLYYYNFSLNFTNVIKNDNSIVKRVIMFQLMFNMFLVKSNKRIQGERYFPINVQTKNVFLLFLLYTLTGILRYRDVYRYFKFINHYIHIVYCNCINKPIKDLITIIIFFYTNFRPLLLLHIVCVHKYSFVLLIIN